MYFVIEVFISFIFLEKPASEWNQWCPLLVVSRCQSDDAHQTQIIDFRMYEWIFLLSHFTSQKVPS